MIRVVFFIFGLSVFLNAHTIDELFLALKKHSQTKLDQMSVREAEVARKEILSKLYPEVNLFGTYDNYSDPTNLLPVTPQESATFRDPSIPQPFGDDIYRVGVKFSMPVFVKSLYTMSDKAKLLKRSAKAKKEINLLQNEALIVASDVNMIYLEKALVAIKSKKKSLLESKKNTLIKVKTGRVAPSALFKIEDALNQIEISKNNILMQKQKLISTIKSLTGITLKRSVKLNQTKTLKRDKMGILKPLRVKLRAQKMDLKSQKEMFYPSVTAHGSYTYSKTQAYNNGKDASENYSDIGLSVNIPILNFSQNQSIQKSKVKLVKNRLELQKQKDELTAQADMLIKTLSLVKKSLKYAKKNIKNKKRLLKIAKVSYENETLTTEEYLRYENDVVDAKVNFYKLYAKRWETLMQLAVIYTNNIEEMVK